MCNLGAGMSIEIEKKLFDEWIYAEHRIQGGFDRDLISEHGQRQLQRALNSRKLIAVTGSGVSQAYGMPSWSNLLRNTAQLIDGILEELFDPTRRLFNNSIGIEYRQYLKWAYDNITELHAAREAASGDLGEKAEAEARIATALADRVVQKEACGESVVAACFNLTSLLEPFIGKNLLQTDETYDKGDFHLYFEICENLYAGLYVFALEAGGEPAVSVRDELHKGRSHLRERLKWQLLDERGRCEILFEDIGLRTPYLEKLYYPREIDAGAPSPHHDLVAALFAQIFFGKIGEEEVCSFPDPLRHHQRILKIRSALAVSSGELIDNPGQIEARFCKLSPDEQQDLTAEVWTLSSDLARSEHLARETVQKVRVKTPHALDPIGILARDLRIKRYLTLNYDGEIDRWLEAQGYHELTMPVQREAHAAPADSKPVVLASRSLYDDRFSYRAEVLAYEPGAAAHLFTYGADTRDNHIRVLHIHGRCRARQSWLVLSERDYRERYARDDDPRSRSDDAMRLIFNANPLLFLGVGMGEGDILRPLRTYGEIANSLSDRPAIALLPQLNDPEATAIEAAKAMSSYGIYNLYYGSATCQMQADQNAATVELDLLRPLFDLTRSGINALSESRLASCDKSIDAVLQKLDALKVMLADKKISNIEGSRAHARHLAVNLDQVFDVFAEMRNKKSELADKKNVVARVGMRSALSGLQSAIITCFFCARLQRLVTDTAEWKNEWSIAPAPRQKFGHARPGSGAGHDPLHRTVKLFTPTGRDVLKKKAALEVTRHMVLQRNLHEESIEAALYADKLKLPNGWKRRGAPRSDRFFTGAPSHAIINLRYALSDARLDEPTLARVFIIMGARGAGRGNVFSSLRSDRRFAYLCRGIRIIADPTMNFETDRDAIEATKEVPRAFFSLGSSHEIVMVFDRLIDFLERILLANIEKDEHRDVSRRLKTLQNRRLDRLKEILTVLAKLGARHGGRLVKTKRIVVALNSLSVFYNENGQAKNSQVRRLIETMLSPEYEEAPIDFILFVADQGTLPDILTNGRLGSPEAQTPQYRLLCSDQGRVDRKSTARKLEGMGFHLLADRPTDSPKSFARNKAADTKTETRKNETARQHLFSSGPDRLFVHSLEPSQPVALVARYFPKVAMAFCYLGKVTEGGRHQGEWLSTGQVAPKGTLEKAKSGTRRATTTGHLVAIGMRDDEGKVRIRYELDKYDWSQPGSHFLIVDEAEWQTSLRDEFEAKFNLDPSSIEGKAFRSLILEAGTDRILLGLLRHHVRTAQRKISQAGDNAFLMVDREESKQRIRDYFDELVSHRLSVNDFPSPRDKEPLVLRMRTLNDLPKANDDEAHYFSRLGTIAGHNRFCMTIVLAALDDMMERRSATEPTDLVELTPIVQFMDRLSAAVTGQAPEARSDTIIEQVLGNYKSDLFNSLGLHMNPWPPRLVSVNSNLAWMFDVRGREALLTKSIFDLQDAILSTLALIGQPVRITTLLGVPDVARQFERFIAVFEGGKGRLIEDLEREAAFNAFMDLLVQRCLVFRLLSTTDSDENYFTVQKTIKRYFLNRMNAPNIDMSRVDQLTVSNYTSQPEDLPKPTAEGNRRIRHLIERLSGFENQSYHSYRDPSLNLAKLRDEYTKTYNVRQMETTKLKRLRLRAAFAVLRSFYSVGVISRFSTYADEGLPTPDFGYFEAHRLRVRWMLRKAVALDGPWNDGDHGAESNVLHTFYAEELVWMYNECGVLSLAQGRINDALSLLTHGQVVARDFIEGSKRGALHSHIGLNLAVALIEKGQMTPARDQLNRILAGNEGETMSLMAEGYLALIHGYQGDLRGALEQLALVGEKLSRQELYRASAIFYHYRAQLLIQSSGNLGEAERDIQNVLNLATNGGHEDIRQKGLLTQTWLRVRRLGQDRQGTDKAAIHIVLDQIETYGRIMGVPRIISRAELVRSELFHAEGEYRMAAEAAQKALITATRFDLELRKISALNRLGLAMVRLRLPEAKSLLIEAREIASQIEFNLSLKDIESSLSQLGMVL